MRIAFTFVFPAQFLTFTSKWKTAWASNSFRVQATFTFIVMVVIAAFIPQFFTYVQYTSGYRVNDLILNRLPVRNMSLYIFLLIYSVILLALINLSANPVLLLKCLQSYCLLLLIRVLCMYFVPLEPEQAIIPLEDPILNGLFYKGSVITKDLFFSGHVSTMALFCFVIPFRPLKYIFTIATFFVAIFILMQHVHYTMDVLAAPMFAWLCYISILKYTNKMGENPMNGNA